MEYISFARKPISRADWLASAESSPQHHEFLEFVLDTYVESSVEELDPAKLPGLLELKYHPVNDAADRLGGVAAIRYTFILYDQ